MVYRAFSLDVKFSAKQECIPVGCAPGRSLTVCWSLLPGGRVSGSGGVSCSRRGGLLQGGLLPGGGCLGPGGFIPACTEADPPPPEDRQTPVKILPWPNFVAAGN